MLGEAAGPDAWWGSSARPTVRLWFVNDYNGTFFAAASWVVLVHGAWGARAVLTPALQALTPHAAWYAAFATACAVMAFITHLQSVFGDPGAVPIMPTDAADRGGGGGDGDDTCKRCETRKPSRAHHCRKCDRCVMGMDHHCPWVNNCVGDGNRKAFLQFCLYTAAASLVCLAMALAVLLNWRAAFGGVRRAGSMGGWFDAVPSAGDGNGDGDGNGGGDGGAAALCSADRWMAECSGAQALVAFVLNVVECATFAGFTAVQATIQLHAVLSGSTTIDRWHHIKRQRPASVMAGLRAAFGPPLLWWLPDNCRRPRNADLGTVVDGSGARRHYAGFAHTPSSGLTMLGLSLVMAAAGARLVVKLAEVVIIALPHLLRWAAPSLPEWVGTPLQAALA